MAQRIRYYCEASSSPNKGSGWEDTSFYPVRPGHDAIFESVDHSFTSGKSVAGASLGAGRIWTSSTPCGGSRVELSRGVMGVKKCGATREMIVDGGETGCVCVCVRGLYTI